MTDETEKPARPTFPPGYGSLTPLRADRHGDLTFRATQRYDFARSLRAVPLLAEEFPKAHPHFPIVFTGQSPHAPLALLGSHEGTNAFIGSDGRWSPGVYVPAYLRRHPFALVRESAESPTWHLCADLGAEGFNQGGDLLFRDGEATEMTQTIMSFCEAFEKGLRQTRALMAELAGLDLFEPSKVEATQNGQTVRLDGFSIVPEARLHALDDAKLAGLARRGIVAILAAHQLSIAHFDEIITTPPPAEPGDVLH